MFKVDETININTEDVSILQFLSVRKEFEN